MSPPKSQKIHEQQLVDNLFNSQGTYWRDTYKEKDIQGVIYQRRRAVAIKYVDSLSLPRTSKVLEIGCGAGLMTLALAQRGFFVEAIDHSQVMIDLTLQLAKQTSNEKLINAHTGDIHELSYENESFDLVIALGVVPWLRDVNKALHEMLRVTKQGGFVVVTADNVTRASTLFDPLTFPVVAEVRRKVRRKLEGAKLLTSVNLWVNAPPYQRHSPRKFNKMLNEVGLNIIKSTSEGFGPFTFLGYPLFSDLTGIKINQKLQGYADKKYPILRSIGSQYIVLATKPFNAST